MDPMIQAQAQAWTVGGAVLGTLIGVAVGLMWYVLTRKKSDAKHREVEEARITKAPKKAKPKKKTAPVAKPRQVEPYAEEGYGAELLPEQKAVVTPVRKEVQRVAAPQVQEPTVMQTPVVHKGPIRMLLTDLDAVQEILDVVVEDQLVLGRNPERAQIVVADHTVSGVHCKFYNTNGKLFLADLASTNGTYVNGIKVDKIMTLSNKDVLKVGQKSFEISY